MTRYEEIKQELRASPRVWLVTGVAGFIGSNLLEALLRLNQRVVGLDNFATGKSENLAEVRSLVTPEQWARFRFQEGDIRNLPDCQSVMAGVDYVLHQAALGSVPRSLEDPLRSHKVNVDGFINVLVCARDAKVIRFVYASSSSVYGDHPALPKIEHRIGKLLSPYAVTKLTTELYAQVFTRCYSVPTVGLRYFNVFGPRQDPKGSYAAVIPKWFGALTAGEKIQINGDGLTSRDFCFIENVVQANILAAVVPGCAQGQSSRSLVDSEAEAVGGSTDDAPVYNIACGERTTLNELYSKIRALVAQMRPNISYPEQPEYGAERCGDVKHSLADIALVKACLGYRPTHFIDEGLIEACKFYCRT